MIAAATLLALTGARSADAPAPPADFDRLAQAPSDQPTNPSDQPTNPYLEDDGEEPEDTLNVAPPPAVMEQQAAPDTTIPAPTSATQQAPPDTLPMASPDTLNLVDGEGGDVGYGGMALDNISSDPGDTVHQD